jgi:GNAT superfamily N-acetyltransferase
MSAMMTRLATAADALEALDVVRQSIIVLCVADHQHDAPTLERWLRNKTPEHFNRWCADPDCRLIVAEREAAIVGVGTLLRSGEICLCYVRPDCVRTGVGYALLHALEAHARDFGITTLKLDSSATARGFYERCGFVRAGDATAHYGVLRGYPYTKRLSI